MNPGRFQHILERAQSLRLLVVGDVMLDEFLWGKVSRISPEAPVPVVEVQGESLYPGGAANVARNLRPFCKTVDICGLVGEDQAAASLCNLLQDEEIGTGALVVDGGRPTTRKTRVVARHQQVVRVDRERADEYGEALRERALAAALAALPDADGVILEDYGKGFLSQGLVDAICAGAGDKPVTADPNPRNLLRWGGVSVLKPNRSEAFAMAGLPDPGAAAEPLADAALLEACARVEAAHGMKALLVTLGEQGMLLSERGRPPYHTPTKAREVFDVSGAGDTSIALFTLALCAGATLAESAELANHAAGIVVGKLGTATLTADELLEAISREHAGA